MTAVLDEAPVDTETHRCLGCGQTDNHPKVHHFYGIDVKTGLLDSAAIHHDHECLDATPWKEQIFAMEGGEGERIRHLADKASSGVRGDRLRAYINDDELFGAVGTGPTMVTTGIAIGQGIAVLNAYHPNTGTTTVGAVTTTAPINIRAMSAIGTSDAAAGTEITTGNSYTSGGAGLGSPTWGTAANVANVASLTTITAALVKTNMPARTIVALEEWDSSGTPLRGWWGAVTSLTTNSGDSVSIGIGALVDTLG